jgi:hypothetical protein
MTMYPSVRGALAGAAAWVALDRTGLFGSEHAAKTRLPASREKRLLVRARMR